LAAAADVFLSAPADEPVSDDARAELDRLCRKVEIVPSGGISRWVRAARSFAIGRSLTEGLFDHPGLNRVLAARVAETRFDAAVVSTSGLAPLLRRHGLERVPGFVDVVDVDSQKWIDYAAASGGWRAWLYRREGRRVRALERSLPAWAAACALVSRAEADLFDSFAGPGSATVATNGVDVEYFQPRDSKEDPACVFVGALDYKPNVDAATWFASAVWPEIRRAKPDAEFRLVGRNPTPAVQNLASVAGITVIGSVPDVRPHVAAAAIAVAPMRLGRGLQNKVLEALAMGKAVVASLPALAALGTEPGVHLDRAESPAEWVRAVLRLLDDPARRSALGAAGRNYVTEHHDWARCLSPFTDLVLSAAEVTPAR
jgi:sugar transferase (PEP-CTERM/EpsH1 system associated)